MDKTTHPQTEKLNECDMLFLASTILLDVRRTVRNIHVLVASILHFVTVGMSITDRVIGLFLYEDIQVE